ncbi:MAG: hypothetical protein LKF53_04510 [Solobacterium sp.]|nr:hypothetical protein [Solobacterium sp.]MCH4205636.1 hypothetical protein [Solobacterium sp.]MCH4227171.1 hypothetical protein [Solobacterium sp.]MCH4282466.1 hypothetical protein [Solobacterium sp.]
MLHIFLFIEIEQIWIEIQVSETASFHRILAALYLMKAIRIRAEDVLVYEKETLQRCDMDVALYALNVQNGMVFEAY